MSKVRGKDTKPEKIVRSLLHSMGYRFRLHRKDLPGKPDIVLPKYKTVIFVHGCYWHQHPDCKRAFVPKSNQGYWKQKLDGNVQRDLDNMNQIAMMGWKPFVIWECETKEPDELRMKIDNLF
jgi:DNA mismatch endonuclease (patch repair protein)